MATSACQTIAHISGMNARKHKDINPDTSEIKSLVHISHKHSLAVCILVYALIWIKNMVIVTSLTYSSIFVTAPPICVLFAQERGPDGLVVRVSDL